MFAAFWLHFRIADLDSQITVISFWRDSYFQVERCAVYKRVF